MVIVECCCMLFGAKTSIGISAENLIDWQDNLKQIINAPDTPTYCTISHKSLLRTKIKNFRLFDSTYYLRRVCLQFPLRAFQLIVTTFCGRHNGSRSSLFDYISIFEYANIKSSIAVGGGGAGGAVAPPANSFFIRAHTLR